MSFLFDERGGAATRPRIPQLVSVTGLLVCCAPLLVLVVRGWANAVLFLGALLSLLLLARGDLAAAGVSREDRRWVRALVVAYVAPILATALAALIRQDGYLSQFDSPSRFLLAVPIFLFVLRSGWPVAQVMQWVLPLAMLVVFADIQFVGYDLKWHTPGLDVRFTTHVVDPLVFGYFSIAFALMCLVSISPADWHARGGRSGVVLKLVGIALGLYFSMHSASRTGWAAVPIVVGVWAHHHWGRGHRLGTAAAIGGALLLPVVAYLLSPVVAERVDIALKEFVEYPWHGVLRQETSIGYRITYLRMAADLFALFPWGGVGDTSHVAPLPPEAFSYATPHAVARAFESGFHNQIVSNAVRTGVGGLLATTALMLVPLLICVRSLRRGRPGGHKDVLMGLAYCTCLVVSSLSTEVVDLKFAASFYAVMTAVLCGAALGRPDPAWLAPQK
jgi:O-antigen ligase